MNTQIQILLLLLCASVALAHFSTGSDFSKDEKKRYDNSKHLAKPDKGSKSSESSQSSESMEGSGSGSGGSGSGMGSSGSGSGSGMKSNSSESSESSGGSSESGEWEHHEYSYILKIFYQFSLTLDISIRNTFILWINTTQMELLEMKGMTEHEILVEFWYRLQMFFEANIEIKKKAEYLYIEGWGYVRELEGLSLTIQSSATLSVTVEGTIMVYPNGTFPKKIALIHLRHF